MEIDYYLILYSILFPPNGSFWFLDALEMIMIFHH